MPKAITELYLVFPQPSEIILITWPFASYRKRGVEAPKITLDIHILNRNEPGFTHLPLKLALALSLVTTLSAAALATSGNQAQTITAFLQTTTVLSQPILLQNNTAATLLKPCLNRLSPISVVAHNANLFTARHTYYITRYITINLSIIEVLSTKFIRNPFSYSYKIHIS